MNFKLSSDFEAIAAEIAAMVYPKTQFQFLVKEIGIGNLAITFKNPRHFSQNFRIKFYPKLKTLIVSGYSPEGMVHLTYVPDHNYDWRNGGGFKINKPSVGEKFEFLAGKFYPFLQEFFLPEVSTFTIPNEFETSIAGIASQVFPQYHFSLKYCKNQNKEVYLNFIGDRNPETQTLDFRPETFGQKESISFDVDFRSNPKCLSINTKWNDEQYLLFYHSLGYLSWNTLQLENINPPSVLGKRIETIAVKLYPLLQEFFGE